MADETRVLAKIDGGEPEEIVIAATAGRTRDGAMRVSAMSAVGRAILAALAAGQSEAVATRPEGDTVRIEIVADLRSGPR